MPDWLGAFLFYDLAGVVFLLLEGKLEGRNASKKGA